jgi:NitT/TauT family transport system substrate-binding protein
MKIQICLVQLVTIILFGCNSSSPKTDGKTFNTSLRLDWITNVSYCGEIYGMEEFASKYNLSIKIEQANEGIDPIKMIIAGQNDFGIVSAERLIMANEKGADLVAIGVVNHVSPAVFIAKRSKNINTPKDFEGHKVGVTPGGSTEFVYRALMKKQKVDITKITEVQASYDMSTFLADKDDITPAYIYVEPVIFSDKGIDFVIIEPQKFGLIFPGRVYFTTEKFIKENPLIVQSFINTMADGWNATIKNKAKAIQYLFKYDATIDTIREKKSFDIGIDYFKGLNNHVLTVDMKAWEDMIVNLKELNIISNRDFKPNLNMSFVDEYYKKQH